MDFQSTRQELHRILLNQMLKDNREKGKATKSQQKVPFTFVRTENQSLLPGILQFLYCCFSYELKIYVKLATRKTYQLMLILIRRLSYQNKPGLMLITGLFGHHDKSCSLLKEIIFSATMSESNKKKGQVPFGE